MWTIATLFSKRGVDFNREIVFYDDISGMRSARGFWFCEYFGYTARVLDGGINSWINNGQPLTRETIEPPTFPAKNISQNSDSHWSADKILQHLEDDDELIIDTRSADEH